MIQRKKKNDFKKHCAALWLLAEEKKIKKLQEIKPEDQVKHRIC